MENPNSASRLAVGANTSKVPFKVKLAYGLGDIYGGGSFNIINFLYAFFLANIAGIPPAWAAAVMMVARLWDAVSDPLMGAITDATRTRLGRRRPYFIAGMPLIVLSMVWIWYPAPFESLALRVAYVMAGYLFYNTVTTLVLVPYSSLAAEITLDYEERNSVNTVRMVFSLASSLMCAILPLGIVKAVSASTGSYASGYLVMALVIGLVFALPYIAVTLGVRERKDFQAAPSKDFGWRLMRDSLKVRSFRKLVVIYLAIFASLDLITTSFQFYMTYVIDRPGDFSAVLGILIVVEIIAALFTAPVAARLGKKAATMGGCALWILVGLATLLVSRENSALIYPIAALMGVAMAFPIVLLNSLFADVTDVGELYYGRRMEGTFSGVQTFVRKCASALANALFLASLGWAGFIQPIKTVTGLQETFVYQDQPEALELLIRGTIAFAPAILLGICLLVARDWPITAERHGRLLAYLEAKREGREPEAGLAAEMEALRGPVL